MTRRNCDYSIYFSNIVEMDMKDEDGKKYCCDYYSILSLHDEGYPVSVHLHFYCRENQKYHLTNITKTITEKKPKKKRKHYYKTCKSMNTAPLTCLSEMAFILLPRLY